MASARKVIGGEVLVAAAAILWALIGVCARELGDLGMPGADVGAWRALIGGACFVGHLSVRRWVPRGAVGRGNNGWNGNNGGDGNSGGDVAREVRRRWVPLVAFAFVGVVVFYAALPLAVETGGISLAYVLLYTAPVWVMVGAVLFLKEHLGRAQVIAGAVSVLGVGALVVSVGGTVEVTPVSVTWGLVAGLSYASYYILGRRLFDGLGPVLVYALVLPAGAVVLGLLARITLPTAAMIGWLLLLGVGCTYLPYLLFGIGINRTGSARAVVVAMIEPVLATLIGVAFYGEQLGALGVIGAVVVLAAAATVGIRREAGPSEVVHP